MKIRFSLRQIEYFVTVSEQGSIVVAADLLNVSSPSISTALTQLEAELDVGLFIRRHGQGLTLTAAGQRFYQQARIILAESQALYTLAGEVKGTIKGPLRVGCLKTFAQLIMPELRRKFEQTHSQVQILQSQDHQRGLLEALSLGRIDIALTYDMEIPPGCSFEPLITLPSYAMFPEGHSLAERSYVSPEELVDQPMILLDLPISMNYFLNHFRVDALQPHIVERTSDLATLRSLVANGYGYGLANVRPKTDLSPDGKLLKFVPLLSRAPALNMGLAQAKAVRSSRLVQAFTDHCRAEITPQAAPGLRLT